MAADAQDARSKAVEAIEDFLTDRLESTQSVSRAAQAAGARAEGTLEVLSAREPAAWQEQGFLSHLNAAAVIEEYYGRRVAQARRELRRERPRKERYARARDSYRRITEERQAVHLWLLDQGWDTP